MNIRESLSKNSIITAIILTIVFFSNQVLGSYRLDLLKYILPLLGIGVFYCVYLVAKDLKNIKGSLLFFVTPCFVWIALMNIMLYLYGTVWIVYPEVYARSYQFLNLGHLLVIAYILFKEQEHLKKILPVWAGLMIIAESIFIAIYDWDEIWFNLNGGSYLRIGTTPCAGVIETTMTMSICLIPVMVELIAHRRYIYILPALIGIVMIAVSNQKSGYFSILLTLAFVITVLFKDRKTRLRALGIIVACCVLALLLMYFVPYLHTFMFERFEDLAYTLIHLDIDNEMSSTSKRLKYIVLIFQNTWDKPIFGHGLYTFGHEVYGYDWTEAVYPDSHTNYTELLYSCGLFGILVYYWFPIKNLITGIRMKHSITKLLVLAMIVNMFFFDMLNISFYRNIIGYVVFTVVYFLIKNREKDRV